ncbi:hypothetical protein APC1466_1932 [Bifidobacterium longum]|nr:hypothetical protein APC1466_1932 [Bifidobacterium longum]PKD06966.1 hypothetical protein APC1465_2028 [Bifidobacterium longum]
MSVKVETTYLATCDYPDCHMTYDFWELTEEDAILEVIDNGEWLCLFAGDNKPRFFCPAHLRYVQNSRNVWSNVFYDSNSPYTQTTSHALNRFYEDMSTPQPLPKLQCDDTILAVLQNEN